MDDLDQNKVSFVSAVDVFGVDQHPEHSKMMLTLFWQGYKNDAFGRGWGGIQLGFGGFPVHLDYFHGLHVYFTCIHVVLSFFNL